MVEERKLSSLSCACGVCLLATALNPGADAAAQFTAPPQQAQVIALSGQVSPDGNGTFEWFGYPSLNANGQMAFTAHLDNTAMDYVDDDGIFLAGGGNGLQTLLRTGLIIPSSKAELYSVRKPSFNNNGLLTFQGDQIDGNGVATHGFYGTTIGGSVQPILLHGQADQDGLGDVYAIDLETLTDDGRIFYGGTMDAGPGTNPQLQSGLYVSRLGETPTTLVHAGQPTPNDWGTFSGLRGDGIYSVNQPGQVLFVSSLSNIPEGNLDERGLYLINPGQQPQVVFQTGLGSGPADETFVGFSSLNINDHGRMAFVASHAADDPFDVDKSVIYRSNEAGEFVVVAHQNDQLSGSQDRLKSIGYMQHNNADQVVFMGQIDLADSVKSDDAIFMVDTDGVLQTIARELHVGNGNTLGLHGFDKFRLNDEGQVLYTAFSTDTGLSRETMFLFDQDMGTVRVLAVGDAWLGSTIASFNYGNLFMPEDPDSSAALNNRGQIAFQFTLADGREGIGLATVPEPAGMTGLLALALWGTARRRRPQA